MKVSIMNEKLCLIFFSRYFKFIFSNIFLRTLQPCSVLILHLELYGILIGGITNKICLLNFYACFILKLGGYVLLSWLLCQLLISTTISSPWNIFTDYLLCTRTEYEHNSNSWVIWTTCSLNVIHYLATLTALRLM